MDTSLGFRHSHTDTFALVRGPRLYLIGAEILIDASVPRWWSIVTNEALFYRSSVLGANSSSIFNFFDVSPCS